MRFLAILFLFVLLSNRSNALSIRNADTVLHQHLYEPEEVIVNALLSYHPMLIAKPSDWVVMKSRKASNRTGVFLLSVALLFCFAGFKQYYARHMGMLMDYFGAVRSNNRSLKDQLSHHFLASLLFSTVYFLCIAYILYAFIIQFKLVPAAGIGLGLFFKSLFLTLGFFVVKYTLQKVIALVFVRKEIFTDYQNTQRWIFEIASMILFPLCILLIFSTGQFRHMVIYLAIGAIGLILLFRYVKLMGLLKKVLSMDFVHFFLYLCAFEILPILAILRFIKG